MNKAREFLNVLEQRDYNKCPKCGAELVRDGGSDDGGNGMPEPAHCSKCDYIAEAGLSERIEVGFTEEDYHQIIQVLEYFEKKAGGVKLKRVPELASYEKMRDDLQQFYSDPYLSKSDTGYPYPLAFGSNRTDFNNEWMRSKFGQTHLRKNTTNFRIFLGYISIGQSGIAMEPLQKNIKTKKRNES